MYRPVSSPDFVVVEMHSSQAPFRRVFQDLDLQEAEPTIRRVFFSYLE